MSRRHLVAVDDPRHGERADAEGESAATGERAQAMAARLRQAVQGCTLHLHGPVQAWWTIEQAVQRGEVTREAVARAAVGASERRLATLREQGVEDSDPRVRKEIITARFMARLFGGETSV